MGESKRYEKKNIGKSLECGGKGKGGKDSCCNSNQFERRAGREIRKDRCQAFENGAGERAGGAGRGCPFCPAGKRRPPGLVLRAGRGRAGPYLWAL